MFDVSPILLAGERLDLKQVESLEDIFKHVRFRCIDLEATHLDDEVWN